MANEILRELYAVADGHQSEVLDELIEVAELGWRCTASLAGDGNLPCGYLNVPDVNNSDPERCQNCGAKAPEEYIALA